MAAGPPGGDSSPDLSLKLRRGSSDSRDSFYMDFAQGIDSDIEEVVASSVQTVIHEEEDDEEDEPVTTIALLRDDASWPTLMTSPVAEEQEEVEGEEEEDEDEEEVELENCGKPQTGDDPPLLPSPASPCPVIVSPETLSHHSPSSHLSSPKKVVTTTTPSPSCKHDALSDRSGTTMPPLGALNMAGLSPYSYYPGHHPAHLYQHTLHRPSRLEQLQIDWKRMGSDALASTLSALYGKLLVVMGIAFPMAEVISTYIPPSFYEGFYLYLYFGSMLFLMYSYIMLLRDKARRAALNRHEESSTKSNSENSSDTRHPSDTEASTTESYKQSKRPHSRDHDESRNDSNQYHYGSFYLRMGAVAFGIGSMIYSGLEFGQYFELERDTKCHNVLLALTPATRMAFIFIQMYFIFLNDEQVKVYKHKVLARFGLMHMIGTNLSLWLNVLIQETKHEILTFYNPENGTLMLQHRHSTALLYESNKSLISHHRVARGLKGPHAIYECRRTNIMGSLVQDASGFLFPCTIEYSLICAAILYVMWKNISKVQSSVSTTASRKNTVGLHDTHYRRAPHHYSVDCAGAHKGLFVGILILVLTIISLILFFVLISKPEFVYLAVMEVNVCELGLYGLSTLATLIGMIQIRQLKFDVGRNLELDNILLIGAQTGMFLYSTFTIIGGHFTIEKNTILVLMTALASLLQTTCQTVFILDASKRSCVTLDQVRRKPGRQIVTFLLVTNLAMWAINTLEKSRAESHPIQLHFYGLWAWTIITHVSMPLAIFYRFHSTVCLCEIWKKAYKIKPTYM